MAKDKYKYISQKERPGQTVLARDSIYVRHGEISGSSNQSYISKRIDVDSIGIKLKRLQIYHSGSIASFNISFADNVFSGSDPRNNLIQYNNIEGSVDYSSGIDVVENIEFVCKRGFDLKISLPASGSSFETFKYMIYMQPVLVEEDKDSLELFEDDI